MNVIQIAKFKSYETVQQTCEKHAVKVKLLENKEFTSKFNLWQGHVQTISTLSTEQAQSSKGITEDKQTRRTQMADTTLAVAKLIRVWAHDQNNAELAERMTVSRSKLLRGREKNAIDACQNIFDAANTPAMLKLGLTGVTAETVGAIQTAIDAFKSVTPKPRLKIAGRKTITQRLTEEFAAADLALKEGLDLLVDQFAAHPEFIADYRHARILVEPPTGTSATGEQAADGPTPMPASPKVA